MISDIASDEAVPAHLRADPTLWSGCISGAPGERVFLVAFERAGFHGISNLERQIQPWQTVEGVEFRSLTVAAWKGEQGPCSDHKQTVVYLGPWRQVENDDGHVLVRLLHGEPYAPQISPVEPLVPVPPDEVRPFDRQRPALRSPGETKGEGYAGGPRARRWSARSAGPWCPSPWRGSGEPWIARESWSASARRRWIIAPGQGCPRPMSAGTFRRGAYTGCSYPSWRRLALSRRLSRALALVVNPAGSVTAAARAVGYSSPTALCRALADEGLPAPGSVAQSCRPQRAQGLRG